MMYGRPRGENIEGAASKRSLYDKGLLLPATRDYSVTYLTGETETVSSMRLPCLTGENSRDIQT